jgi:hypothetical protein
MNEARKDALIALRDAVAAGVKYETMGHTRMCQRAFPKPDDFDESRQAYADSEATKALLAWRNGDLNAARKLHDSVLTGWGWELACGGHAILRRYSAVIDVNPPHDNSTARAWLIAILSALISEATA